MMMMAASEKKRVRIVSQCTGCGNDTERDLLTVKKVMFTSMGAGAKTDRSRVIDRLCPLCVAVDPEYNLPETRPARMRKVE